MNKRIKQLAAQCWDERLDGRHFDQEMFAKLIILECINICGEHARDDGTAQQIIEDIKKEFGVEGDWITHSLSGKGVGGGAGGGGAGVTVTKEGISWCQTYKSAQHNSSYSIKKEK